MREVYQGNGFIITTNDCGEIFVTNSSDVKLRIGNTMVGDSSKSLTVRYLNNVYMEPAGYRSILFRRR